MNHGGQSAPDLRAGSEIPSMPSSVGTSRRSGHSSRHHHHHRHHGSSKSSYLSGGSGSRHSKSASALSRGSTAGPLCMTLEAQQKMVQEAAMDRHIRELEKDATQAVVASHTWKATVQGGFNEETNERNRRRKAAEDNQNLLMMQMESNKSRRAENRRDFIHAASSHSFPLFTETFIDEEEYERIRKEQKAMWRQELDSQKVTNDMLRNIEEKKLRDLAARKQRENVSNMTKERGQEHSRMMNQGQDLVKSWDREVRLKTLRKAMDGGRDVTKEVSMHLSK